MTDIKTTTYVKKYFNDLASPYSNRAPDYKIEKLQDIVSDIADLHAAMRADNTIGAYETFDVYSTLYQGAELKSEPQNLSILTVFGSVRHYKDIKLRIFENGEPGEIPYVQKFPHTDPEDVHIIVDNGGISINVTSHSNARVIDRATDAQVWPVLKP